VGRAISEEIVVALIDPDEVITVDIPDEPGQWVKFHALSVGMVETLTDRSSSAMAARAIVEWSYPIPPTHEAIRDRLDVNTAFWLISTINAGSGLRTDPESNGSEPLYSPTSEPVTGDSQPNSDT
jgi:hypothetical protein